MLPRDLKLFGYNPDRFSIARAVRMSMSIPLFYEPVRLKDVNGRVNLIVDGGVLSNYPVWLLDDGTTDPPWPTFGFKLIKPDAGEEKVGKQNPITNPISFLSALVGTMLNAHDKLHISRLKGDYDRTIKIPTVVIVNGVEKEIKTTDFGITPEESRLLFKNGVTAAGAFLKTWDFEEWKRRYRQK